MKFQQMAGNKQYLCTSSKNLKTFASSVQAVGVGAVARGWPAFLITSEHVEVCLKNVETKFWPGTKATLRPQHPPLQPIQMKQMSSNFCWMCINIVYFPSPVGISKFFLTLTQSLKYWSFFLKFNISKNIDFSSLFQRLYKSEKEIHNSDRQREINNIYAHPAEI